MRAHRIFLLTIILLLFASLASAESYYADIVVDVAQDGETSISGTTNHPELKVENSQEFTSKQGKNWLLNLSLPEEHVFSDVVYSINLPEGASINYVKAQNGFRIETEDNRIGVKGTVADGPFKIIIQYQLGTASTQKYWLYMIILPVFLFFTGFVIYFSYLKSKEKASSVVLKKKTLEDRIYDSGILTDRQKDIMKIILHSSKTVTQTRICEELNLPKSSVSRNIDSLVSKGLIKKEKSGMSTIISLSDIETYEKEHKKQH